MASQTRTYTRRKLLGQVYTPFHIVDKILNDSGFYHADLNNKKILDPACGDGRFLIPVVEHIIKTADHQTLIDRLHQIHGWDVDPEALTACKRNLDALIEPLGLQIAWNIRHCDALKQIETPTRFDFIIGNPPYIRIQHLSIAQRRFIQAHYDFCKKGSTDAYIAFFELASRLLSPTGICGFITPNGYMTSETGQPLRTYFEQKRTLKQVTNYGSVPVFENASTYSAITIFGNEPKASFKFEQCQTTDFTYEKREVLFLTLPDTSPWQLSVSAISQVEGQKLGDICQISVGLTTLADGYYIFSILNEEEHTYHVRSRNGSYAHLEKSILKPVIKASKLKTSSDPVTEYILFPYQKDSTGKQRIIPENILREEFPQTYSYLLKVKSALDRRDNGKPNPVAWYAYGRAQGLDSTFGKKIIFSPMNLSPNFVLYENPEVSMYSGYFIKYNGDYQALLSQLNSPRMAEFIAVAGRDFQGGYKGYNKKVIENFIITSDLYD